MERKFQRKGLQRGAHSFESEGEAGPAPGAPCSEPATGSYRRPRRATAAGAAPPTGRTLPSHQPVLAVGATHKPCRWLPGRPPSLPRDCAAPCRRIRSRCGSHSLRCTSSCTRCAASAGASGRSHTRQPRKGRSEKRRRRPRPGTYSPRSRVACNSRPDTSCRRCAAPAPSNHSRWSTHPRSRADKRRAEGRHRR